MVVFVLNSSCDRTPKEEVYLNALERSNVFISEANEWTKALTISQSSRDPRLETLEMQLKLKNIDSLTTSFINELKKNEVEIKSTKLNQFKKDLIRNNIKASDMDYFFMNDFYEEAKIKMIPYQVAINDVSLLVNQMFMYYASSFHWSDMKIDKQQAIFNIDSNTYLALFAYGPEKEIPPQVTINSIMHNGQKLSPDQYSFQYRTGFYGVIMNLDGGQNDKLGEYIIRYEINWNEKSEKQGFKYEYANIFLIEE